MALPEISVPEFDLTVPSSQEEITIRPFLVREEKLLYIAQESDNENDRFKAIQKILKDCILTPNVDVSKLASFDLEYLFLNLRARSVSETTTLRLKHPDEKCNGVTEVELNLLEIQMHKDANHTPKIQLTDDIGVVMRYPTVNDVQKSGLKQSNVDRTIDLISSCVKCVYDKTNVYEDFTNEEVKKFVESLSQNQFEKILNFFNTIPKLSHDISWKCSSCGEQCSVTLEGLRSFFTYA